MLAKILPGRRWRSMDDEAHALAVIRRYLRRYLSANAQGAQQSELASAVWAGYARISEHIRARRHPEFRVERDQADPTRLNISAAPP